MTSETRSSPVRDARKALDLRLVDVAEKAGIATSLISMIEHGYVPSAKTREKLAKALNCEPDTLWPEEVTS
jgi:transcriptional regulator with XRE-family HTH domain